MDNFQVDDELEIKAYYAGHVLGAAMFHLRVGTESLVYTVSVSTESNNDNIFLANDVTLVTSYGYCQSLKINDRRLDRCCTYVRHTSVLRFVRLGGYSVRRWVGVCTGTLKVLPYQRHKPIQLMLWE